MDIYQAVAHSLKIEPRPNNGTWAHVEPAFLVQHDEHMNHHDHNHSDHSPNSSSTIVSYVTLIFTTILLLSVVL